MRVDDYDYELPEECIAQAAIEPRDAARMLHAPLDREGHEDLHVRDLERLLSPGDLLVVNDTRVLRARMFARRPTGGRVELLCLEPHADGAWRALARPARKLSPGDLLTVEESEARVRVDACAEAGEVTISGADGAPVAALLERHGRAPLPPYVRRRPGGDPRDAVDLDRYQTVYAERLGAVAAPTAGLHFTTELLERLAAGGVERACVTLHVGIGTFRPVTAERAEDHEMHSERYEVPQETVAAVEACRARGGRVVAVGTTSVRALEAASASGQLVASDGATSLFIRPGYRFRSVDGLLTNFHLPRSTLLMLVSAFGGRERVLGLYQQAVRAGYRFYSYGDALLLL